MTEINIFSGLAGVFFEVIAAVLPLTLISVFVQIKTLGYDRDALRQILLGYLYLLIGVTLFLHGVTLGFFPIATKIGRSIAKARPMLLIPTGFLLGLGATVAEPAVRVLMVQVEEASVGRIKGRYILYTLCLGVGLMVAIGMARIIFDIPIEYLLVPGYLLAMALVVKSDSSFVSMAFDSAGVATGPMSVAFLSSLSVGVSSVLDQGEHSASGFGLIALIALAAILGVLLLGFIYTHGKRSRTD